MLEFDWLAGISTQTAKWVFLLLFILIGLLVSMLPKSEIYEGLENPRWWHNLKLWAWGVLGLIFITYSIF